MTLGFREEVLHHKRLSSILGPVLMNLPLSTYYWGWGVLTVVLGCILLVMCLPYAETISALGTMDLTPGIVRIYPRKSGIIIKQVVSVGQAVKKGQVLQYIKTIVDPAQQDQQSLIKNLIALEKALINTISHKKHMLIKARALLAKHYISRADYDRMQESLYQSQQQLSQLTSRRMQAKMDKYNTLISPINGIVAAIQSEVGQWVTETQPLIKIIPESAQWVVQLWVPIQSIRFIHIHQPVILRYDPYPFRQFGTDQGEVSFVSQTLSTASEDANPTWNPMKQPFYKVSVRITHSHFQDLHKTPWRRGNRLKPMSFYQGMSLVARFEVERTPLWKRLLAERSL